MMHPAWMLVVLRMVIALHASIVVELQMAVETLVMELAGHVTMTYLVTTDPRKRRRIALRPARPLRISCSRIGVTVLPRDLILGLVMVKSMMRQSQNQNSTLITIMLVSTIIFLA